MTTLNEVLQDISIDRLNSRQRQLSQSLFTAPPINPFQNVGVEPSEQQLALQARNAPAERPEEELSTARIDGTIARLNDLDGRLSATGSILAFDQDRIADIRDALDEFETGLAEAREDFDAFEAPSLPDPVTRILSIENSVTRVRDAQILGTASLPPDTLIGERSGGNDISLVVSRNGQERVITAGADETFADFADRVNEIGGVYAELDNLNRISITSNEGGSLELSEAQEGTFSALALLPEGETAGENGETFETASELATRFEELLVDRVSVTRAAENYQFSVQERKEAIAENQTNFNERMNGLVDQLERSVMTALESSFERGSVLFSGQNLRLPQEDGVPGGGTVRGVNLSPSALSLDSLRDLITNGSSDDVENLLGGARGQLSRAESNISVGLSALKGLGTSTESQIGRLNDERDAIIDAFSAQQVARNTGLSLSAINLATAENRSNDLRNL